MIRLVQRRLIVPRGDTGSFSIPAMSPPEEGDIAVFTIFDEVTQTKLLSKKIVATDNIFNIVFTHNDTVNLKPGKYFWDIKFYRNPQFVDDELVNGDEINSYYAGFTLPICEIRETGDNYLIASDTHSGKLLPEELDIISGAITELNKAIKKTDENVKHYPEIRDGFWYVWDAQISDFVNTGVSASGGNDYNQLNNKPQINGIELLGNRSSIELQLQSTMKEINAVDIDEMIFGGE